MRRALVAAIVAGGLSLTTILGVQLWSRTTAQPDENLVPAPAASAPLPIAQVVLYSSGVGYFQREGEVQGNARVDLTFPVHDINDLLKSMVLEDLGGRPHQRRRLRQPGAYREDAALLCHQLDQQPLLRPGAEPGPWREGGGRAPAGRP